MIYIVKLCNGSRTAYLLWGEVDGVGDHFLYDRSAQDFFWATSLETAVALRTEQFPNNDTNTQLHDSSFDFDAFWRRLSQLNANRHSDALICKYLLDGWNFLEDFATPAGIDIKDLMIGNEKTVVDLMYQKLFHGCNLPAFTPEGQVYYPIWSKSELELTRRFLKLLWTEVIGASAHFKGFVADLALPRH